MRLTRLRLEVKLEDLWVGAFWKHTYAITDDGPQRAFTDVWLCLLPCLPIHATLSHDVCVPFEAANLDATATEQPAQGEGE